MTGIVTPCVRVRDSEIKLEKVVAILTSNLFFYFIVGANYCRHNARYIENNNNGYKLPAEFVVQCKCFRRVKLITPNDNNKFLTTIIIVIRVDSIPKIFSIGSGMSNSCPTPIPSYIILLIRQN